MAFKSAISTRQPRLGATRPAVCPSPTPHRLPSPVSCNLNQASRRCARPFAASSSSGSTVASPALAAAAATLAAFLPLTGGLNTTGPVAQAAVVIQGPARVVDGDTLVINQQRIRLYGIDAPEKAQSCKNTLGIEYSCGQRSKEALTSKVGTQAVTCTVKNQDQYGRNVSICTLGGGFPGTAPLELNSWLVENGLAVAYRQYGKEYVPLEERAQAEKKGVWEGPFTPPAEWRKQQKAGGGGGAGAPPVAAVAQLPGSRPEAEAPACPGGALPIKGNISSSGEKIYHVPGGRSYNLVKIEVSSGERFFCDESQAQAAGWRASK